MIQVKLRLFEYNKIIMSCIGCKICVFKNVYF